MTTRKRRILIVLGAVAATLAVAAGVLIVDLWPHLPDRVTIIDGQLTFFYILPR